MCLNVIMVLMLNWSVLEQLMYVHMSTRYVCKTLHEYVILQRAELAVKCGLSGTRHAYDTV